MPNQDGKANVIGELENHYTLLLEYLQNLFYTWPPLVIIQCCGRPLWQDLVQIFKALGVHDDVAHSDRWGRLFRRGRSSDF